MAEPKPADLVLTGTDDTPERPEWKIPAGTRLVGCAPHEACTDMRAPWAYSGAEVRCAVCLVETGQLVYRDGQFQCRIPCTTPAWPKLGASRKRGQQRLL